jgi:hypothetical protein
MLGSIKSHPYSVIECFWIGIGSQRNKLILDCADPRREFRQWQKPDIRLVEAYQEVHTCRAHGIEAIAVTDAV